MSGSLIRVFPDPVLRKTAERVSKFDKKNEDLVQKLIQIMKSQAHGIGIAAPQIGVLKQIAVVDVSARVPGSECLVLINPVILDADDVRPSREGCMSVPEYTGLLNRYFRVKLRWMDLNGQTKEKMSTGIEAVCIQHEIDHLNGMLFLDRVGSLKTDMIPRHLKGR